MYIIFITCIYLFKQRICAQPFSGLNSSFILYVINNDYNKLLILYSNPLTP